MKRSIIALLILILIQGITDLFFASALPEIAVGPLRAAWIGFASLALLILLDRISRRYLIDPFMGAFCIFSSAFFGALLVQAGHLVSKSTLSTVVHIGIVIVAYILFRSLSRRSL